MDPSRRAGSRQRSASAEEDLLAPGAQLIRTACVHPQYEQKRCLSLLLFGHALRICFAALALDFVARMNAESSQARSPIFIIPNTSRLLPFFSSPPCHVPPSPDILPGALPISVFNNSPPVKLGRRNCAPSTTTRIPIPRPVTIHPSLSRACRRSVLDTL